MYPPNRPPPPHLHPHHHRAPVPSHVYDPRVTQSLHGHGPRPLPPPPHPIASTSRVGSVRPTPASRQTSVSAKSSRKSTVSKDGSNKNEEEEDDDDEDEEDEEGGVKIISGIKKQRRIVLSRRTYLLSALVVITILCIGGVVYGAHQLNEHGHPPVEYASECSKNAFNSLIFLLVISPIGFFVLKFRVTNMLIGLAYMFMLVLCIIYPVKAVINGLISLHFEDDSRNRLFISDETNEKKLHKFWGFHQKDRCCGTRDIDRVEDWPYLLNSTNIPPSCCTAKWRSEFTKFHETDGESNDTAIMCGLGLGGWRTKALPYNYTHPKRRLFSGFYAMFTEEGQLKRIREEFKVVTHPEDYTIRQMDIATQKILSKTAVAVFEQNWQNLFMDERCNLDFFLREYDSSVPFAEGDCENKTDVFHNDMLLEARWDLQDAKIKGRKVGYLTVAEMEALKNRCETKEKKEKSTYGYMRTVLLEDKRKKANEERAKRKDSNGQPISAIPGFTFDPQREAFCKNAYTAWRRSASTLGRPLLLNLDYITSYLSDFGKYNAKDANGKEIKVKKNLDIIARTEDKPLSLKSRWVAWEIPLKEDVRAALAVNLLRKDKKFMYYLSRGIAENAILRGVVTSTPCGYAKDKKFHDKLARDMNKRWIKAGPLLDWKNPDYGLGDHFVGFVQKIVGAAIVVSGVAIVFVIIIAIVFWQYYSRIKAEDYANLALPKEFEVLHMKRGSLIEAGEMQYEPQEKQETMMSDVHAQSRRHKNKHHKSIARPSMYAPMASMSAQGSAS